uniref:Uncharacterized protein n=1 Tax=Tetranychus urticae TaxID=32264 RepID=T1K904_TETUR
MLVKPKDSRIDEESLQTLTLYHYFALLASFAVAVISASFIIESYLSYPTITTVKIERPRDTELPSISLCFFYEIDQLKKPSYRNGRQIYPLNLSQIDERLPKLDEWIKSCKVLNATTYRIHPCLQYYNHTVEYLSVHAKCYSFFESLPEQIFFKSEAVVGRALLDVTFNNTVINSDHIGIFITHTYAELEDSLSNPSFLQFNTTESNIAVTTFARTAIRNLPSPYHTQCFRYDTLECRHRSTCIRHCINKISHNKTGTWHGPTYVKLASEFMDGYFTLYPHEADQMIYEQCQDEYQHEPCNQYLYEPVITSKFTSSTVQEGTFRLAVVYPNKPKVEVKLLHKTKLSDSLIFLAGIVHLCTGVSLLAILIALSINLESVVRYFKQPDRSIYTFFLLIFSKVFRINSESFHDHQSNPSSLTEEWNGQSKMLKTARLNQFTSHRLVSPTTAKSFTYYSH